MSLTRIQRGMIATGAVIVPDNLYTSSGTASVSTFLRGDGTWQPVVLSNQEVFTTSSVTFSNLTITNTTTVSTLVATKIKIQPDGEVNGELIVDGYSTFLGSSNFTGPATFNDIILGDGSHLTSATSWAGLVDKNNIYGPRDIYLGYQAGASDEYAVSPWNTNLYSIFIGDKAGADQWGPSKTYSDNLGRQTTVTKRYGRESIAIGRWAGDSSSDIDNNPIGPGQGNQAIAIGSGAGHGSQGAGSVAIGGGQFDTYGYRVGNGAGSGAGSYTVAIGPASGIDANDYSISLGWKAGGATAANSIVLTAEGNLGSYFRPTAAIENIVPPLTAAHAGFYVSPVRPLTSGYMMYYNTSTAEITYGQISVYNDRGTL